MSDNARKEAQAHFDSIRKEVRELQLAREAQDYDREDEALEEIRNGALSLEFNDGWYEMNSAEYRAPEEYRILLCTGGPAVKIEGQLDHAGNPTSASILHQDWGTPWTELWVEDEDYLEVLLQYAGCFLGG